MNIILPEIKRVKLSGYSPIFDETVEFTLKKLYILLGGNGLGKSTILQSVIYAIAGPSDGSIESEKSKRWGRNYFRQRLQNHEDAFVEIDFNLGETLVSLKRGFNSDSILEFYLNKRLYTDEPKKANNFFEQFVVEHAGFNSLSDFNYIVHKLCYLSEKRENLVWDVNAQTRILMRLVSDAEKEMEFNHKRNILKNIDSKKRHLDVDYNRLLKTIKDFEQAKPKSKESKSKNESNPETTKAAKLDDKRIEQLQKDLINQNKIVKEDLQILREQRKNHSKVAKEVEELRDKINLIERNYFFKHLHDLESKESKLALYKLIHNAICPSCGNKSKSLQDIATENLKNNKCVLCGTEEISEQNLEGANLNSKLAKLLKDKTEIEKEIISIEKRIERAQSELTNNELRFNQLLLKRKPVVVYLDKSIEEKPSKSDLEQIKKAFSAIDDERKNKIIEFNKLQKELDSEYLEFSRVNKQRIENLSELYKKFASEFLGTECSLQEGESSSDKFLELKLLVPKFNDILRSNPDSCSEAQRFFLDIALRMSFIELSKSLSTYNGSFICETPESALDITYINNVSDMFKSFSFESGNSILMSSNIQSGGIAQSLLREIPKHDKTHYFLNMIEIGNLSDVQSSDEGVRLFQEEIDKILLND